MAGGWSGGNHWSGSAGGGGGGGGEEEFPNLQSISLNNGVNNELINFGAVFAFTKDDAVTYSAWFKKTDNATDGIIFGKTDTTTQRGTKIGLDSDGVVYLQLTNNNGSAIRILVYTNATGFDDSQWHHLAVTYSGNGAASGCRIYIDGSNQALTVGTDGLAGNTITSTADFIVGNTNGIARHFIGLLDELSVWSKNFSAAEVTELYNGGVPADCMEHSAVSDLEAYWRFETASITGAGGIQDSTANNVDGTISNMDNTNISADVP